MTQPAFEGIPGPEVMGMLRGGGVEPVQYQFPSAPMSQPEACVVTAPGGMLRGTRSASPRLMLWRSPRRGALPTALPFALRANRGEFLIYRRTWRRTYRRDRHRGT